MIEITADTAPVRDLLKRLEGASIRTLAQAVLRSAHATAGVVSRTVMERFPEGTNELARSFVANVGFVQQTPTEVSARTHSPLPYAGIQDQGGTIRPRTAKALAVPLTPEARRRWPRDWPHEKLHLIVLRGKALLVELLGKGKIRPHYVLKDSVTLTGKHYIGEAKARAVSVVDKTIRDAVAAMVRAGGK